MKELLFVSNDEKFLKRLSSLAERVKSEFEVLADFDSIDLDKEYKEKITVIDARSEDSHGLAGMGQVAMQMLPNSKIILIMGGKVKSDELPFIYKSGVHLLMSEEEFLNQSKLEFYCADQLHYQWIPVKSFDFELGTKPDFVVYHFIAFKGKFFPVIRDVITQERFAKIQNVNELYIKKEDLPKYHQYLKDLNIDNQMSQTRAKFLEFSYNYIDLVLKLTDNSKKYTYDEGKKLLSGTEKLSRELVETLSVAGANPWMIVSNLAMEVGGSLARVPAIAAYAGIGAMKSNLAKPEDVMLSALIADLGLLKMSPETFSQDPKEYKAEDKEIYQTHPLMSINLVLERKLPLEEEIKRIILNTHENKKGTGFPKGPDCNVEKIPVASQIIQVAELVDKLSLIKKGSVRPDVQEVKTKAIDELIQKEEIDFTVLNRMKLSW